MKKSIKITFRNIQYLAPVACNMVVLIIRYGLLLVDYSTAHFKFSGCWSDDPHHYVKLAETTTEDDAGLSHKINTMGDITSDIDFHCAFRWPKSKFPLSEKFGESP